MDEYRVFGPPGTGKTTYLTNQIEKALGKYWPNEILVASFTRAGAITVARRTDALPKENIGTLHAFCFRALNQPEIAEKHIAEFNEEHPEYAVGHADQNGDIDDPFAVVDTKNALMLSYQTHRAKCIPRERWDYEVDLFGRAWEHWLAQTGYTDLTGLIERGIEEVESAPTDPRVAFFDEAQDFTRLEMKLVDKWSKHMDKVIKVGDDDQMIYSFKGATTDSFNGDHPEDKKIHLKQSWRLPQEIVNYSTRWISQIHKREHKPYFSEREGGFVKNIMATYKAPSAMMDEIARLNEEGKTCMIITTCGFMLDSIKARLFDLGLAWHNPYKPKRGDWNPLNVNKGRGISSLQRLISYMNVPQSGDWCQLDYSVYGFNSIPKYSPECIASILDILDLKALGMKRGCKASVKLIKAEELSFVSWFEKYAPESEAQAEQVLGNILFPNLEWFKEHILEEKRRSLKLAFQIIGSSGSTKALETPPLNTIGTIHSVKGGEADYVFLAPDVSKETMKGVFVGGEETDAITRLMYVGMTRARHGLYLLQPATYQRVEFLTP